MASLRLTKMVLARQCGHARRGFSAAAEAAAGLLRSGDAGPSLAALERLTVAMPPQPVSIAMLQASTSAKTRLLHAQFLHRELTARRAHVLSLLYTMPSPLAEQPAVARLATVYWERLMGLLELPQLSS